MSEQRYLPYSELIHRATESWGPDSAFGHVLTYLLVVLPLGWLALKALFSRGPVLQPARTAGERPASLPSSETVAQDA